ncbi:flippase [Streptococcus porcorum]
MKKNNSVKINFIMNFILTISNFIFPLITFPYVSRVLGAEGVGTVTFAASIVNYFSMVGMLGIPTYGIRACAKVRDDKEKLDKTVQEIVLLNSIVMFIAIMGLVLTVATIGKLESNKALYLILSSTLVFNVLGVDWLYRSLEQYSYITIRSIIFKVISMVALFLFVRQSDDYLAYAAITVLAGVGSNLMNFINLRKFVNLKPIGQLNLKQHLKPTLSFFMLNISTTIYVNVDTTMLGFIKGNDAVGYYSAATKLKQILVSIVTSLGTVLLPRLSYYYEAGKYDEFKSLVQKALNFVFVIALPIVVYFTLIAKQSILFLSGSDFLPATPPMQLMMPTVLFIGLSNLMGIQVLVPTNHENVVVRSTIVGAIINILVNLFAIPLFGPSGAAFASSVAEFSVALLQLYFLRELILPLFAKVSYFKLVAGVLLGGVVTIYLLNVLNMGPFLMLVITGASFFNLYGLVLLVTKEPLLMEFINSLLIKFKRS